MPTVVTIGKFDGYHKGHLKLIEKLLLEAETKDLISVVLKINSGNPGLYSIHEQEEILKNYGVKRFEVIMFTPEFAKLSPEEFVYEYLIKGLDMKSLVVGTDFRFGKDRAGDIETLKALSEKYGFDLHIIEKLSIDGQVVSSTYLKQYMAEGDMESYHNLCGRYYSYSGIVEHGKHLGTALGFPTVNILPEDSKLVPKTGVYSSVTFVDNCGIITEYGSITNVGYRPTVSSDGSLSVETFIYDFDDDIYGQNIRVELRSFIRGERTFDSTDDLVEQIKCDIEHSKNTLHL